MNKQTEKANTPAAERGPYDAPRLTVVELRSDEALLTRLEHNPLTGDTPSGMR